MDERDDHYELIDSLSRMNESEHDKISSKDSDEDNCKGFRDFI